jgi:FKBP-type peptidyl-prolyl cis-trans isomerase (trigger factor)
MPSHSSEEIERGVARRVYRVSIPAESVSVRVAERLKAIGKTVRLPGFRPGKIPDAVLQQRYGAKYRAEAIERLGAEAADEARARGELAARLELIGESADGVEFRLEVTHLAELADLDFGAIEIERLSAPQSMLDSVGATPELLDNHCRQAVLDYLDGAYRFPLAPQLIEREYALIRLAAEEALESDSTTGAERAAIKAQLGSIAERRVRLGAVVVEMARRYEIASSEEKLIQFILSKARVTDREATIEELRELADAAG